jgi:pyrrolysine biosynthesis protein PylC
MKILIVGGKLQGIEITYLAKKAGYYSIVVDKNQDAPAADLGDRFRQLDAFLEEEMLALYEEVDVVIPAIENKKVLQKLLQYGELTHTKVVFDQTSYEISSSKRLSNDLFQALGLPLPEKFPNCEYPIIIKPDDLSGSSQVYKVFSKEEAEAILASNHNQMVIQEYLEGNSYSLEVLGDGENFYYPQITEVVVDEHYDCKRIIAPANVDEALEEEFLSIAHKIANSLKIKGLFDIEVIHHKGILKLLEIDARFPSQTPISIYQSCGINMVAVLAELALGTFKGMEKTKSRICYYQQIVVKEGYIQVLGEHVMEACSHLKMIKGFFGADEAITDYVEGCKQFHAIMMITEDTYEKTYHKFLRCIDNIKEKIEDKKIEFVEG